MWENFFIERIFAKNIFRITRNKNWNEISDQQKKWLFYDQLIPG